MNYGEGSGLSASDVALIQDRNNGSFGGFGGDGAWWIVLFLIFALGGWNNNGNGGNCGGMNVPYMLNSETQRGFDQSALINGIQNLGNAINNGFSNQAVSQCNQTTDILGAINNTRFDTTNAITTTGYALNNTMMQNEMNRQQCCCDIKQGIGDLKYTVATENCADRQALNEGIRDVIASNTANTQAILDKLCQQEIDAKNDLIATLRSQLNMASLRESQTAQNAFISQGFANEVDQLYNRLNNCPVPSTPVYGRTPIFTCNNSYGCNCGNA